MIIFGKPFIRREGEYSFLVNSINIDGNKDEIWFKVRNKFEPYLCFERDDAYLIAVLNYAMLYGHDMEFEAPITEELLFNINTYLIPALIENNPGFYSPVIKAEIATSKLPNAGAVGTGISCGVDSLHAVAAKANMIYKNLNITHLTFNNVGSHGEGIEAQKLYQSRLEKPRRFSLENGFKFVESNSNLMDIIKQDHFSTHTYSSMFPIFCLQKLYKVYYYASGGYKFNEFKLKSTLHSSCGAYELLSLPVFSTSNLRIYSEGMGLTRLNKLKAIINYRPSYKYLNVCLKEEGNCNKCEKCIRTLLGLDALGALDNYSEVFDIEFYRTNKKWYLQQMLYQIAQDKHDYFEMYPYFKTQITFLMRLKVLPIRVKEICKKRLYRYPNLYRKVKNLVSD